MLQKTTRRLLPALSHRTNTSNILRTYATSSRSADNPIPANDPTPRQSHSPVSSTNATATSSEGSMDKILQESVEKGEERRVMQAPNRKGVWSRSQKPRAEAMVGPRFEQTIMEDQVGAEHIVDVVGGVE